MIQAPTLLERWAYFYAHSVRGRERAGSPSLMRDKYGGCLPRVFCPSGCKASMFSDEEVRPPSSCHIGKTRPAVRAKAKHRCSMQQLTLQFEGFAPIGRPETPGTAKQCKAQADSPLVRIPSAVQTVCLTVLRYHAPFSPLQFVQAALCVASAFGMMFFAAIIGG